MRRLIAYAALTTFSLASLAMAPAAHAETWKPYSELDANGVQWAYEADYSYRDVSSGRVVVMHAISKPAAKLGPSGPGKPDGAGSVVALNCNDRNMISVGSYTPSKPLEIANNWRTNNAKKIESALDKALFTAICVDTASLPAR